MTANEPVPSAIERGITAARARFPGVNVSSERYRSHAQALLDEASLGELVAERHAELYLCCACLGGDATALIYLERDYLTPLLPGLARLRLGAESEEDLLQELRTELLVGGKADAGTPKLARYRGEGSLQGWLRVTLTRAGLRLLRSRGRRRRREERDIAADVAEDVELGRLRERYAAAVGDALERAFARLEPDQRTLLRLRVVDGLSEREMADLYGVDRSTVSRWIARVRERLLADTRALLMEAHAMRRSECDSVMRLARSDVDVSVRRLLGDVPGGGRE